MHPHILSVPRFDSARTNSLIYGGYQGRHGSGWSLLAGLRDITKSNQSNTMARLKRTSPIITDAETRAASLASVDPNLELSNGLSLPAFKQEIAEAKKLLEKYNTALATADSLQNDVETAEDKLAKTSSKMLTATGLRFGTDSDEYESAGGTPDRERKRGRRKVPPTGAKTA